MNKLIEINKPILDFCKQIELSKEFLISQEEPEKISLYVQSFSKDTFYNVSMPVLQSLTENYSDAFTAKFSFAGDFLEVNSELNETKFDGFRELVKDTSELEFEFKLDKKKLAENINGQLSSLNTTVDFVYKTFIYLFPESLIRFLSSPIEKIESILWNLGQFSKAIILIPGYEIFLNGSHLSVIGGNLLKDFNKVLISNTPSPNIALMYDQCQELLRWKGFDLKYLTPLHFKIEEDSSSEDIISKLIYFHQSRMIIFYSAEQVIFRNSSQYLATYSGEKQRKEILVDYSLIQDLSCQEIRIHTNKLLERIEWIYFSSYREDALHFLQLVIVRTLQISESDECFELILKKSSYINDELKWLWKAFIEKKIDSYMEQVKSLEDYVSITTQSFSDQVSSMVKSVSETMLAAVGIALASFIAALFKDGFNPTVFRIGIIAYGIYVLIFPLIYNMCYQQQYFRTLSTNFSRRRKRFELLLDEIKVSEIIDIQVKESEKRFKDWTRIICSTYIIVAILAFSSAFIIPALVSNSTKILQSTNVKPLLSNVAKPASQSPSTTDLKP
jgi:hypothetical protein